MVPPRAVDPELLGRVDDRFHTQNQAELVVHLQPVGLHAVLDTGTEPAIAFIVGVDFTIKPAIPFAAEKAEDVLGGERQHRIIKERAVQAGERRATSEQQVRGVLSLIDDPMHGVTGE